MPAQYSKHSRGVSLVEVILALTLFSIIFAAVFDTQWQIGDLFIHNVRSITALHLSSSKLLNILNNQNPEESVQDMWGIQNDVVTKPFTRCEDVKDVKSSWRTGWRSTSTMHVSFISSDLDVAHRYGDDCGGQPKHFSVSGFQLTDTVDLGFPASSVDIANGRAFVSLRSLSESDADVAAFSLLNPHDVAFLDFGIGANKIDAATQYAFVAQHSSTSQVVALDSSPHFLATSTLPNVAGVRPEAISISYFDSKIYVGTKRTAGHEFHIYDVSDPASPRWLGSREVNHNINDISVKDGFAFLATSGNIRDLIVLDIRDPTHILQLAAIDLPGNEDGRSIQVMGNTIFLGRYKGTVPGHNELSVLEYQTDPTGNSIQINEITSAPTGADIYALTYAGGFVFTATSNIQKELQVFELNQENELVPVWSKDLPAPATGIDYENEAFAVTAGNSAYVFTQTEHE